MLEALMTVLALGVAPASPFPLARSRPVASLPSASRLVHRRGGMQRRGNGAPTTLLGSLSGGSGGGGGGSDAELSASQKGSRAFAVRLSGLNEIDCMIALLSGCGLVFAALAFTASSAVRARVCMSTRVCIRDCGAGLNVCTQHTCTNTRPRPRTRTS